MGAFCRAGHPVLDLAKLSFHDLLPYRFAGAHFPVALLEHIAELFKLRDRHVIELAIQSDNSDCARCSDSQRSYPADHPGCVRNELAANLIVELPIDLNTPAKWRSVTLKTPWRIRRFPVSGRPSSK